MSTKILIQMDSTGSMSPCIREVSRRVSEALDKLFGSIPDLKIGIIVHGDWCDEVGIRAQLLEFTDDKDLIKSFVRNAHNTNGGDSDEFYEYLLHLAQGFSWGDAENKIYIPIGDANPHRVGYSYRDITNHYDWKEEAAKLASLGVTTYSIQALGSRYSESFWRGLAEFSNGKKLNLNQFSDAVETIIAVCYHKVGRLDEYQQELTNGFKMNRNLAALFADLGSKIAVESRYTKSDASGLIPVSPTRFQILHVDDNCDIKSFVENAGIRFHKGRGFYQFTKPEMVQEHKEVVLCNKITRDMFTGAEARNFIGLPFGERGKIRPKYFEDYEVYIQSTSSNRKLMGGTKFLYENEL